MIITETDQLTLDLDWFFTNKEEIGFVASGGGKLPVSVSEAKEDLDKLSMYFRSLPLRCNALVNCDLDIIANRIVNDLYLNDFIGMAEKGIYSYDKTVLGSFSNTNYHLVASPTNPIKLKELPADVLSILTKTKIGGAFGLQFNIDFII